MKALRLWFFQGGALDRPYMDDLLFKGLIQDRMKSGY